LTLPADFAERWAAEATTDLRPNDLASHREANIVTDGGSPSDMPRTEAPTNPRAEPSFWHIGK